MTTPPITPPAPPAWLQTISEDLRGNEHIAKIPDVSALVREFVGVKTADWKAGLPEDLRAEKSLESFKGIPELAKGFVETKKLVGQKLAPPGPEAPDEEWEAFFRQAGKPERPDGYKIDIPTTTTLPKEVESELRAQAHALGLNQRQTQKMVNNYVEQMRAVERAEKEQVDQTTQALKEKWGGNYARNTALIERTLEQLDPKRELRDFLDSSGLGNHPVLIDLFHKWSMRLVEDNIIPGDVQGVASRDEAKKKLAEIQSDLKHPYHTSKAGDQVFEDVRRLNQIAYD